MTTNLTLFRYSSAARQSRGYSKIYAILLFLLVTLTIFITGCKKDDYDGEISGVCPVVSTDPINGDVDVPVNKTIGLTFNTDMKGSTVNTTTVLLKQGSTTIIGAVGPSTDGKSFTFNPASDLQPFETYTGTVTTGAKDTLRTSMVEDYVWSFTTAPRITLSSNPVSGGTTTGAGDFAQGSSVTVTAIANPNFVFTSWKNKTTGNVASTLLNYSFIMNGNVDLEANFSPVATGSFAVILSSNPPNATNLEIGGTTIGSGVYSAGTSVSIRATAKSGYTFTGWTGDATSTVNPLNITVNSNKNIVANFSKNTTPVLPGVGPAAVPLGTANNFTILTKNGITNVSQSSITGNIGASPITGAAITGLSCPEVSGIIYTVNAAGPACRVIDKTLVDKAVFDMEAAFTFANGLTLAPITELGAGNLNATTAPLAPGLYKWSTGVSITTEITLSGTANDRWVFQIAGNLTVNNDAKIKLIGGADPKNITWVISGATTSFGTSSDVSGTFLTSKLISLNTGAKVTGRLLSQTEVTLIKNTVVQP